LVKHVLVAFHDQLMRTRNQRDIVGAIELSNHIAAKQVAGTTRTQAPAINLLGIRPQQVAHGAIVWYFLLAINQTDLNSETSTGRSVNLFNNNNNNNKMRARHREREREREIT
jgi:hypothetical protein